MLGDDYVISVTVWWKELSHCEETYAWVNLIFISWIHFFGGDYFSGRICYTFTIMASSVSLQGSQSLEHEKLARRVFKSRKPREGFAELLEETEVGCCGWNDNGSSKSRHVLQTDQQFRRSSPNEPELLLALNNIQFTSLFTTYTLREWRRAFCCSFKNEKFDIPPAFLSPSFPLFCDGIGLLLPCSVLRISLLFYELLDLSPQRLQILLLRRVKTLRHKYNL